MSKNNPIKVSSKPLRARNATLRAEGARKHKEAVERQVAYDALTTEQKFAKLDAGGFVAAKQRAKLLAALAAPVQVATKEGTKPVPPAEKFKKGAKAERQRRNDKKAAKTAKV